MGAHTRWLAVGLAVLAVGVGLLLTVRPGLADDEVPDPKDVKAAQEIILKAAGDEAAMKKAGENLLAKKLGLRAVMYVFKPRMLGGIGLGKEGEINPDGIEPKLVNLKGKMLAAATATKEGPALEKAAGIIETMSYVTDAYTPKTKMGEKDPKDWIQFTKDMRAGAEDLAKAAKAADPKGIKSAAVMLNKACNDCHIKFRD
jgi:hypothetical protein